MILKGRCNIIFFEVFFFFLIQPTSLFHKENLSLESHGSFCKRTPSLLWQRAQITGFPYARLTVKQTWNGGQDGPAQGLGVGTVKDDPEKTLREGQV